MSEGGPLDGRCLCGAVRYRLDRVPDDVAHCHCRMCQRAGGAAFVTWATVPEAALTVLAGDPVAFRSSTRAQRFHCGRCGAQLFFRADGSSDVDVTVATLDEPDRVRPVRNIWVGSRLAICHGFDAGLPDRVGESEPVAQNPG